MTTAFDQAKRVADAVLYEGYLLYPYRASSSKNQVRWQFGVLGPAGAVAEMVGEDTSLYTECLLQPTGDDARVDIQLRFLQTQSRSPQACVDGAHRFEPVAELRVGAANWISWHEAVEQEIQLPSLTVTELLAGRAIDLDVPGREDIEVLCDEAGVEAGRLLRTRYPLRGRLTVAGALADSPQPLIAVRVEVENTAQLVSSDDPSRTVRRDLAARQSFVGTHLLLTATSGKFVSVIDPPAWAAAAAGACSNARCWPVLAGSRSDDGGDDGQCSEIVLGSPIILGDFPAIAQESPGQLFDSAEIDEILTLRIMTMTDEEKVAARGTDPRAAAIIARSDGLPPELLERLHGAVRSVDPAAGSEPDFPAIHTSFGDDGELTAVNDAGWFSEQAEAAVAPETDVLLVAGVPISKGSRVRLRPGRRADAHDMFLAGQSAVVRRIDLDVDGNTHVAVLLEDDPASDLHDWHGRFYYFGPDEIEPLASAASRGGSS